MNKLKGYRTVALNTALFIVMLVAAITGQIDDPQVLKALLLVSTIANVVMRFLTDTAVGNPAGNYEVDDE